MALHHIQTVTEKVWQGGEFLKRTKVVEEVFFKNGNKNLKTIAITAIKIKDGTLAALNFMKNLPPLM